MGTCKRNRITITLNTNNTGQFNTEQTKQLINCTTGERND